MATIDQFQTRFPEFCEEKDSRVQMFLDDAAQYMGDVGRWQTSYDRAHQYHAAHLLYVASSTLDGDGGSIAPTKKQEVDGVMFEAAVSNIDIMAEDYYASSYGKQYVMIRMRYFSGPVGV